jgi:hypothetical protein
MDVILAVNDGPFFCVIPVAVVLLGAAFLYYAYVKARKRREAMAQLAQELGLQFYRDDPWDMPVRYAYLDLFGAGHSRKASNLLTGRLAGREVILFDYQYTTGSGKNSHTYTFQAALLETPVVAPKLSLRREGLLDKVAAWVGHDDLNFESAEFSKRYFVKCTEPKFAYDILHARLIEYLLACGDAPTMEMIGPLLLLHDSQGGVEQVRRLLAIGQEILRSIPDYVRHERGIQAAGDKA